MRLCMLCCVIWKSTSEAHTLHTFAPMRRVMQCECTLAAQLMHCTAGPVKTSVHALHVLIIHVVPRSGSGPIAHPPVAPLGIGINEVLAIGGDDWEPTPPGVGLITHWKPVP